MGAPLSGAPAGYPGYGPPGYPTAQFPPSAPEGRRRRPGVVTTAALLMFLMAVAGLVVPIIMITTVAGAVDEIRERAAGVPAADLDEAVAFYQVYTGMAATISIVSALVLAALGIFLMVGWRPARILTWVYCGIGLLCGGCGLIMAVGAGSLDLGETLDINASSEQALTDAVADAFPGWWLPLAGGVSVGQALGYIAVAVLLMLPAASAYFRKSQQPAPWPVPPAPPYAPPRS